MTETIGA